MELRKALKLSLNVPLEESDKIFQNAKIDFADTTVNFEFVLAALAARTEYSHIFAGNPETRKKIFESISSTRSMFIEDTGRIVFVADRFLIRYVLVLCKFVPFLLILLSSQRLNSHSLFSIILSLTKQEMLSS